MPRLLVLAFAVLSFPAWAAGLDVVFLLDTTGSMGGELSEAKDRSRQLAEALQAQRVNQRVRLGVVAFRDQGDAYVTTRSPLSERADDTFTFLASLTAEGGGDGPEDVLAGLATALDDMNWDQAGDVERQIFLIGDAPPHEDYANHLTAAQVIAAARRHQVVVHAIGCRSLPESGQAFFQKVAWGTEGTYQHIGRVNTAQGGLAQAMLKALTNRPRAERLEGASLAVTVSGRREGDEGLALTPIVTSAGVCTLRLSLPEGLALRGVPAGVVTDHELELSAQVTTGGGGTWLVELGRCVDVGTRVRLVPRS